MLFGVAVRTKKPLALPLSPLIWKMIIGEPLNMSDLEENDTYYAQNLTSIQNIHQTGVTEENFEEVNNLFIVIIVTLYFICLTIDFVGNTIFKYDWYRLDR